MNLAFKISLSNCGQTLKNRCFTAKQALELRFKVLIVVLLMSLLGMMLYQWAFQRVTVTSSLGSRNYNP
jgi:uncharacterized membrane protein